MHSRTVAVGMTKKNIKQIAFKELIVQVHPATLA
jgi:hypothetical protein